MTRTALAALIVALLTLSGCAGGLRARYGWLGAYLDARPAGSAECPSGWSGATCERWRGPLEQTYTVIRRHGRVVLILAPDGQVLIPRGARV